MPGFLYQGCSAYFSKHPFFLDHYVAEQGAPLPWNGRKAHQLSPAASAIPVAPPPVSGTCCLYPSQRLMQWVVFMPGCNLPPLSHRCNGKRFFFITSIIPVYPRFWIVPFVSSLRAFLASKVSPVGDFRLISPLRGADAVPSLSKDDLPEPLRLWTTVPSHPAALGSLVLVLGPPPAPHLTAGRSRGWCWCSALCAEQGRH